MSFTKFASYEVSDVLDVKGSRDRKRIASLDKLSDYHDYRTDDGYMYVRIRAISSRVNKNHDGWPSVELAGGPDAWEVLSAQRRSSVGITVQADRQHTYGYSTFLGKPIFVDHHNSNPERARGVIVDAKLHVEDHRTASELDPYYSDAPKDHLPPTWVELLLEVDAKSFPKLAKAIVDGGKDNKKGIDGFSMGCDVEKSRCNICANVAEAPDEYCDHIKMKGATFNYIDPETGNRTSKKSYEDCYGIKFFEISAVFDPADETALTQEVRAAVNKEGSVHTAVRPAYEGHPLPTPRTDIPCPHCGSRNLQSRPVSPTQGGRLPAYNNLQCADCGTQVPVGYDDPGLQGTQYLDRAMMRGEQGGITDPADFGFDFGPQHQGHVRTAENPPPQSEMTKAPEQVDTLRKEQVCPVCGEEMEGETCKVCGYTEPPDGFGNPDLTKAQDRERDEIPAGPTELGDEHQPAIGDKPVEPPSGPPSPGTADAVSYLQSRKPGRSARVRSEMAWKPSLHKKVAGRINSVERPIQPNQPSGSDEPKDEKIVGDQTKPVTSHIHQEIIMGTTWTKVAAEPADSSGKPDKRVSPEGVGGIIQDTNEQASRADKQVATDGKGGVIQDSNAEASRPDEKDSIDQTSDNAGFDRGGNPGNNSGPTKTFDNSNEPGSAVTERPFPRSEEGVKASGSHFAYDDRPFPHGQDANELSDGAAKQGVQPGDPVFKPDERVNVKEHVTSPANNSGDTKTWSGTDGNGVTRQQQPVTNTPWPSRSNTLFAAFKLADTEVDLGLISREQKYARVAELEGASLAEIDAQLQTLARVKTAGLRRQAATQRMPSLQGPREPKEASVAPDDSVIDSALFSR